MLMVRSLLITALSIVITGAPALADCGLRYNATACTRRGGRVVDDEVASAAAQQADRSALEQETVKVYSFCTYGLYVYCK